MFQKVLIAEDHSNTHSGLEKTLGDLGIKDIHIAQYCDDAELKIKAALQNQSPFELLITDLRFKEDHRDRKLSSGKELIEAIQKIQPSVKIIVFSVEYRIGKIKYLLEKYRIDGYVEKGRDDAKDLRSAIHYVLEDKVYCSPKIKQLLRSEKDLSHIDSSDTLLLQLLAKGKKMKEISMYFQQHNLAGSSVSSLEKKLFKLKTLFNAENPKELLATVIERGLI